jgi:Arc/MetJ family transcription regulator
MKTSIDVDDKLFDAARRVTGLQTEHDVIEAALRRLVQLEAQEKIRELRGKVTWEGDLEESRRNHST